MARSSEFENVAIIFDIDNIVLVKPNHLIVDCENKNIILTSETIMFGHAIEDFVYGQVNNCPSDMVIWTQFCYIQKQRAIRHFRPSGNQSDFDDEVS